MIGSARTMSSRSPCQTIRRWLIVDTLASFFSVISDSVAAAPEEKARWDARRQFWSAYLRKGYIQEAWVALSRNAREMGAGREDLRGVRYADSDLDKQNSVLILVVNGVTIVEASNVGPVRLWREGDGPELYLERYKMSHFVRPAEFVPHQPGWQKAVAGFIKDETGISMSPREYL